MNAIIVEDKLADIFGLIPSRNFVDMTTGNLSPVPKPTYHFGDYKEFNALIKITQGNIYPVLYQISNTENQDQKASEVTTDLEIVIATRETSVELLNNQRWAASYKNILMPLVNNVVQAINECGIIRWDGEYTLQKVPNYSQTEAKDSNAVIDIIDAIVFRATITIEQGCMNRFITFNK